MVYLIWLQDLIYINGGTKFCNEQTNHLYYTLVELKYKRTYIIRGGPNWFQDNYMLKPYNIDLKWDSWTNVNNGWPKDNSNNNH